MRRIGGKEVSRGMRKRKGACSNRGAQRRVSVCAVCGVQDETVLFEARCSFEKSLFGALRARVLNNLLRNRADEILRAAQRHNGGVDLF
jgi:hypothetical protein